MQASAQPEIGNGGGRVSGSINKKKAIKPLGYTGPLTMVPLIRKAPDAKISEVDWEIMLRTVIF